ncbi:CGNR zinc finger domain-containing protein [Pseudonocardia lacus]|uniref:CGNR zinc finger domain-containing protein n=1 Tax=Pseudonocardia lacus TaxID=2835865 RepID=UPI0027E34231|nr:CGNR zinc finger domain-containing protein [Pseudonocardia lacus]
MGPLNVVGGHVALDLVNTVEPRVPGGTVGTDHLGTPDDLARWAVRGALLDDEEAERVRRAWTDGDGGARAHAATLEIREATYAVLLTQLGAADGANAALDVLVGHWRRAMGRSTLSFASTDDRLRVGTDPELVVPDRLAHAAVALLRTLDVRQLKACPLDEGGCGWLFLDRSRNGSRRWCSMGDCGTRAKSRRLTERRRGARSGVPQSS